MLKLPSNKKVKSFPSTKWERFPYGFNPMLCSRHKCHILICLATLGSSACADFSVAGRNNSGVTSACVDRDLSDGDSCIASPRSQEPIGEVESSL